MVYADGHAIGEHLAHLVLGQRVVPPHEVGLEDGVDGLGLEIGLVGGEEEVVSVPVPRLALWVGGGGGGGGGLVGALWAHCRDEGAHGVLICCAEVVCRVAVFSFSFSGLCWMIRYYPPSFMSKVLFFLLFSSREWTDCGS